MKASALFAIVLTAACGGADAEPTMRACTQIGCRSPVAVITGVIALPNEAAGEHRFDVVVDGAAQTCSIRFARGGSMELATCTGDAELMFGPSTRNVEDTSAPEGTVGVRIEAIPGTFTWQLTLPGTHREARVVHHVEGAVVAERSAPLTYIETRPNGPDCEPVCQQAVVTWDFTP